MRPKKDNKTTGKQAETAEAKTDTIKQPWWFNQPLPIDRFTGWLVAWTSCLSIATFGLILVAILQWRELHSTDAHVNEQVQITADQLKIMQAGQRAWVEIGPIEVASDLEISGDHAETSLKVNLKNTGNLPALRIEPIIQIYPNRSLNSFPPKCTVKKAEPRSFGFSLFPNETYKEWANPIATTESGGEITPVPKKDFFSLGVVGCILYESAGDPTIHLTGFAGIIIQRNLGGDEYGFFNPAKSRYAASDITFMTIPIVGQDAL